MLDIQQKRKFRNVIYHRVTLGLLFILVALALHSTWKVYLKRRESLMMKEASITRLKELDSRNQELESKIKKLGTVSGVEEEIRSKFSVAKSDENVVIIVREDGGSTTPKAEKTGFWAKLISLFD
ncbi:MAG: hypothetical protein CEO12_228 [Parcubacteria group bacterium Gr01-1014_46]|nr:MAG: hypothetical protein CEO12_228 [Parcubacteria group bacterium Gr01-1014_46]